MLWDLKLEAWSFLKPVALVTPSDIRPLVNQFPVASAMYLCHLFVSERKGQLFFLELWRSRYQKSRLDTM